MQSNRNSTVGPRSIWARGTSQELPDLIRTLFGLTLLAGKSERSIYFCSPWISDFPVFNNVYREYASLSPDYSEQRQIRFSDFLLELSSFAHVRIVTTRADTSRAFLSDPRFARAERIQFRYADDNFHEKGILSPQFYLEGSMNITFMGVHIRQEKVLLHTNDYPAGQRMILGAYLEFDRRWERLDVLK